MKKLMIALTALFVATALWGSLSLVGMSPAFAAPLPADEACAHAISNAEHALPFNTCATRPSP